MPTEQRSGRTFDTATEAPELSAMTRRVLDSLVRRAGSGDIDALIQLRAIRAAAGHAEIRAARALVAGPGKWSWGEIGKWLDISRQAVRQRYRE
jgi:hypothetical protein